jgi:hypothetical protein
MDVFLQPKTNHYEQNELLEMRDVAISPLRTHSISDVLKSQHIYL